MRAATAAASILITVVLIAVIALYVWMVMIAFQCIRSDDLAYNALGAVMILLMIQTLTSVTDTKKHHDTTASKRSN